MSRRLIDGPENLEVALVSLRGEQRANGVRCHRVPPKHLGPPRKSELVGVCRKKKPKFPIVPKIEQILDEEKIPGPSFFFLKLAAASRKEGEKGHITYHTYPRFG